MAWAGGRVDRSPEVDDATNVVTLGTAVYSGQSAYGGLSQGYLASGPTLCQVAVPMVESIPVVGGGVEYVFGNSILDTDVVNNELSITTENNASQESINITSLYSEYQCKEPPQD